MVEWTTGMDYWNGLPRMRIRAIRLACPRCPAQARESSCIPCNHPYARDDKCPNWKSLGICSHSVAAAEDNGDLHTLVEWLKKSKRA